MGDVLMVVEIRQWDWPLAVGVIPASSREFDPGGPLMCVRSVNIGGLVLEPEEHLSKRIYINLMPLPREIIFGDPEAQYVGSLYEAAANHKGFELSANLYLPEDTLQQVVFCLGATWRQVYFGIDVDVEPVGVTHFGFSSDALTSEA